MYRDLSAAVLGYVRAQGARDPEDVVGEVFLQVARDLRGFADVSDPVAVRRWVFTIARHRLIDAARRDRRRDRLARRTIDSERSTPSSEEPDAELLVALRRLTDEQREVLALRFVADLALDDVARLTGRSVGAVKALQHRALENLRSAVSPGPPRSL